MAAKETATAELKGFDKSKLKAAETSEKQSLPDSTGTASQLTPTTNHCMSYI